LTDDDILNAANVLQDLFDGDTGKKKDKKGQATTNIDDILNNFGNIFD